VLTGVAVTVAKLEHAVTVVAVTDVAANQIIAALKHIISLDF
tara:strand:- start:227 stop:352 length:126 start_codon:yes stop_codon:yes gene_type:complete